MQPTRCTRCPRKKCGILVATKIQVTSIDDIFCMRSVYSCRYVLKIFDIERRCKLTGLNAWWPDAIYQMQLKRFFRIFCTVAIFFHFCDLFLVTPATEARPACISFNPLMPKIRSPDGSEFLSFRYRRHFWNSSLLSGNLRNASVYLDLWEYGLQCNCVVVRCR